MKNITIDQAIRKLQSIKQQLAKNPPGEFKAEDAGGFCLVLCLIDSGIEYLPCDIKLEVDQDGAVARVDAKLPAEK